MKSFLMRDGHCSHVLKSINTYAEIVKRRNSARHMILWLQTSGVFSIAPNTRIENWKIKRAGLLAYIFEAVIFIAANVGVFLLG